MDIPEKFAGNQLFTAIEVTVRSGNRAIICASGEMGRAKTPEHAARVYESMSFVVSARVLVTIEGISEAAALVFEQQAQLLSEMQGLTRHSLLQLLVAQMQ
ncbi:hypothetical protein A2454_05795 [Candidatus Peribacteria bacterium RIFOXYC2_FULL_55_14]|nr:MAG: hypothetical protein UY87_C0008G0009 [Candidatus Peribacteria bacterium GW2011_GWC2_54_8]KKW44252.1 MAG: hypothetical protein UY90_C0015G0006 [Candidatus Peregrinibacteria bacterium GW2011_GWA2_54_9]OGJ72075.1 MAG: hypothetical protein A2198_04350 [Candidatus Peribacteria bacterium RIFOXYA1_FULL_56_14]OGJ74088.1 MAG: hypothetical protein A2217_00370 [Candidatus Peribacteria bacterium RIFOXYA2_FULL_55_28]OGJ75519.1 MAG: hypothetical protein A2384_01330 [Candidatus Peribacteria bacterium 